MASFQTERIQQLTGLKPVDGVFKLEGAIQDIDQYLQSLSPTSSTYSQAIQLKQTYSNYLNEAKQLREKGMASFRKYLAMKNDNTPKKDNENLNDNNNTNNINNANNVNNVNNINNINNVNNVNNTNNANIRNNRNNDTEMMQLKDEVCICNNH